MAQIGGAVIGETGKTYGNKLGNQRKLLKNENYRDEVAVTGWYNGNNTGKDLRIVARFINPTHRERIVTAVLNACNNPHIGYDQKNPERYSLRSELLSMPGGICPENFGKVKNNCACDCSELVCLCIKAACGIDFGKGLSTGDLWPNSPRISPFLRYPNTFTTVTINKKVYEFGYSLIPGDIPVWRNVVKGNGHTAIVVTSDDSYVSPEIEKQIVTGIVLNPVNQHNINNVKTYAIAGQTKNYTLEKTKGPVQIAFLDDKDEVQYITKVVAVNENKIPYVIYGQDTLSKLNVFIGDSRTIALGSNIIDKSISDSIIQYGFFPDNQIMANSGLTVMPNTAYPATTVMINAGKKGSVNAYIWAGINDVQIYRDTFVVNDQIQTAFVEKWFERYKQLVELYVSNHKNADTFKTNKQNKVFIVSIYPTSRNELHYYDKQNDVIHTLNLRLSAWVEQEQQGLSDEEKETFWLQFVWLYNKNGITASDISETNFINNKFNFKKNWYVSTFLPKFNFNDFVGEEDNPTGS